MNDESNSFVQPPSPPPSPSPLSAAGAGAGLISSIFSLIFGALFAGILATLAQRLPPEFAKQVALQGTTGLIMIPVNVVLYAGFGALGGFLSLLLFFKNNRRN